MKIKTIIKFLSPRELPKRIDSLKAAFPSFKDDYFAFQEHGPIKDLSSGNYHLYKRLSRTILSFESYCIIDVGASDGWFAKIIYHFKPNARIIAFEPLSSNESSLAQIKQQFPKFEYHMKALGEKDGSGEITEYQTKGLSSFKKLSGKRYEGWGGFNVTPTRKEIIKITTLDHFFEQNNSKKRLVLKIDTQGFEMEVLRGAKRLFSENRIDCVVIELATISKYEGQTLSTEILRFFDEHNFIIFDIYPSCYERNGALTEFDTVFVNRKSKLYEHIYGEKK